MDAPTQQPIISDPAATCDDGSCTFDCPDPGNCDDGICTNGEEVWDGDNCNCITINVPVPCTDDGDCSNGDEVWDPNTCTCSQENLPIPCVDDGDCSNGFEVWDANTCTCIITPSTFGCTNPTANNYDPAATCDDGSCTFDCPDPGNCDDGICTNGEEVWDGDNCNCITINVPVPCTDDGDCSNGDEVWDPNTCTCSQENLPIPCVDDGDCSNGFEVWDANTCTCIITPSTFGCTNPTANNYDPAATCEDGSCTFDCPDPGNCDDGICTNGEEVWDGDNCNCITINVPVPCVDDGDCSNGDEVWDPNTCTCSQENIPIPCVDDGDCSNGFEIWDANTCSCNITPPTFGCTNTTANNYDPAATCDDGSCTFDCPDPGNCDDGICTNGEEVWDGDNCNCITINVPVPCVDDGDCANGFEVWDSNTCTCNIIPPTFGCTNPTANNYDPAATCDDGSCTFDCPDPGNCDDGDCANGEEFWDGLLCECQPGTPPVDPGCDDGDCSNGVELWDGCECQPGTPIDCTNGTTSIVACDDGNADTFNDQQTVLDCDGTICAPCLGTPCNIQAIAGPNMMLTCIGEVINLNGSSTISDVQFIWSGPDINVGNMNDTSPAVTLPGIYSLVVVDQTNNCMSPPAMVTVSQDITVPDAIIQDPILPLDCQGVGSGVLLEGTGSSVGDPFSYQWIFNNALLGSELTLEIEEEGVYTFIVTNEENGCTNSAEITVTEPNVVINPIIEVAGESCFNQEDGALLIDTVIGGQPPYLYSLASGNFSSFNQFTNLSSGTFDLIIQDADGCESNIEVTIPSASPLVVNLGDDQSIELGDSLQLSAFTNISPDTIIWVIDPTLNCTDCLEPVIRPVYQTTYQVTIFDVNGCSASDQINVFVDKNTRVFIPNIFSPNGDGINDEFIIHGDTDVTNFS